jgi:translocation and assembly module TamB
MNWKRIIGWIAIGIVGLMVVLALGGYFVLRSHSFHRYVLAKIVEKASASTGGKVEIGNFDFHWSTLTADAYNLIVHGTEPGNQRPLLQADKLTVRLKILSVLHEKINLREILIEHPVAHLLIDAQGRTNIPQPTAPKQQSSSINVFDLAVGHALLNKGEIYYNDRKSSLDADIYDLHTDITFDSLASRYRGALSYASGKLKYGTLAPLPHTLQTQFIATRSRFALNPMILTLGSSRVTLRSEVTNYDNPRMDGSYEVLLHTADFAGMSPSATPAGDVALNGGIHYFSAPNLPFLRRVAVDGQLRSDRLTLVSPDARLEVRAIRGRFQIQNGNLVARDVGASLLNGQLAAELDMQHLDTTPVSRVRASLRGISLQAAKESLRTASLKQMPLSGRVDGNTEAAWNGSINNLKARSDVTLRGAVQSASADSLPSAVPLNGAIHVNYDGRRSLITLRDTILRTPATSVIAQGEISDRSNLTIQAKANDLRELAKLASALRTTSGKTAESTQASLPAISGSATINALVQGSMKKPRVSAQLAAQNLTASGTQWSALRASLLATPSQIAIQNGSLVSANQGQASFGVTVGLRNWSYMPSNPISIKLAVRQMPLAPLERIAGLNYPISGNLVADVAMHGSQVNPIGSGSMKLLKGKAYDEPIQNLALQFQAAGDTVNSTANLQVPAGSAVAKLTYLPKTRAYQLQADVPGITLEKLAVVEAKNLPVNGKLTAMARGAGTLDNPQLTASVQIPKLDFQQTTITQVKADMNLANHHADATLSSGIAQASVQARVSINLTDDYYTTASIDTTVLPATALLAVYVPSLPEGLQGQVELHASAKGPLRDKSRMEAHLVIPKLNAEYQSLQIANTVPIRVNYAKSIVALEPGEIRGTDTALRFRGQVPLQGTAPMTMTANGNLNLRLLRMFSPDLKSSGIVNVDLRSAGSPQHPSVAGQIRLQNASITTITAPLGLSNANGTLDIANDQVRISNFTGQVGGGDISAGGTIAYRPQLQFNVALNGKSVRLRYPEGLRAVLDSNLTMTGTRDAAAVSGRVLLDSLSFTREFDLADFMGQFTGSTAPPSGENFADNIKLDVSVQSTQQLQAVSSEVSIEGQANLRVIGTASNPVIVGRADLTSGEIFLMKQRYQLERGIINFTNPDRTTPDVNMSITTTIKQYNLTLSIVGPIDKLRTNYVSDPPLPPVDIINLIARGQTTEEATPPNLGANSLLAQGVASQASSQISKLAGLSSLQIDPLLGGENRNPSARVGIQQRVTKNFLFTFSTDVTSAQNEVVQGEYQLNKRWSVSATRNETGGVAFEGKFHTVF